MSTTTTTTTTAPPHIALFPCAGMGHLIPSLRLASTLSATSAATITLITAAPTVSAAESNHLTTFFTNHPTVNRLEFHLTPHKTSKFTNPDPFWQQMEAIEHSIHLLHPLISSLTPPLSAIVADFPITGKIARLGSELSIPVYAVVTTSATFFAVMNCLPELGKEGGVRDGRVEVPGLGGVAVTSVPPPMLDPDHYFSENIRSNVVALGVVKGVFVNTFDWFEPEAIGALGARKNVGRILPIGPFESFATPEDPSNLPWLDEQAPESVVFVSFGSRTTLSKDQIGELGKGLEKCGQKFLLVLKGNKVDKDDNVELEELLGESFLERTKDLGLVVKGWVDQDKILAHNAIGGFVSHCGWNSVMEAARLGVKMLAWPQHGDQRVNAEVVEKAGLGLWVRGWGWGGGRVVGGDEIGEKVRELMVGEKLRESVIKVKEKASEALGIDGGSKLLIRSFIQELISNEQNEI